MNYKRNLGVESRSQVKRFKIFRKTKWKNLLMNGDELLARFGETKKNFIVRNNFRGYFFFY